METWDDLINRLSDTVEELSQIEPPDLAYRDAYDKMMEACWEFAVAHYG